MSANRSARSPRSPSVCTFTFADGRQCRIPRRRGHPYLCTFHARKEAQALAGEQAGQDIASFLSGSYISACDLTAALARLFSAVAQGHLKPKTAATLAYLGQTMVQALRIAQHEFINAFGTNSWRATVASSIAPPPAPTPPKPLQPRPPVAQASAAAVPPSRSAPVSSPSTLTSTPPPPLPSTPSAFAEKCLGQSPACSPPRQHTRSTGTPACALTTSTPAKAQTRPRTTVSTTARDTDHVATSSEPAPPPLHNPTDHGHPPSMRHDFFPSALGCRLRE